jgi:hypothetical protein
MSELPQIDPSWTHRRSPPAQDHSPTWVALTVLVVVLAAVWYFRHTSEVELARQAAAAESRALANEALLGPDDVHYISEAEADRQSAEANGIETLRHCVSGAEHSYQTSPCVPPFVETSGSRTFTRDQGVTDEAAIRARANAKLLAEQQRFDALTGRPGVEWTQGTPTASLESARQHCDAVKAQRDVAYRLAGNRRSFDFIRSWEDRVYQACKNS